MQNTKEANWPCKNSKNHKQTSQLWIIIHKKLREISLNPSLPHLESPFHLTSHCSQKLGTYAFPYPFLSHPKYSSQLQTQERNKGVSFLLNPSLGVPWLSLSSSFSSFPFPSPLMPSSTLTTTRKHALTLKRLWGKTSSQSKAQAPPQHLAYFASSSMIASLMGVMPQSSSPPMPTPHMLRGMLTWTFHSLVMPLTSLTRSRMPWSLHALGLCPVLTLLHRPQGTLSRWLVDLFTLSGWAERIASNQMLKRLMLASQGQTWPWMISLKGRLQ